MTGVVTLTFDDAYASVHRLALPMMAAHGARGTVFVVAGWVDNGRRYQGERTLDWAGCEALRQAGWEIGSHGMTHTNLLYLGSAGIENELLRSRDTLRHHGFIAESVAYPGGSYDRVVYDVAAGAYAYHRIVGDDMHWAATTNRHGIVGNPLDDRTMRGDGWERFLARVARDGAWAVFMIHHVGEGRGEPFWLSEKELDRFLGKAREIGLHVAPMAEAATSMGPHMRAGYPDERAGRRGGVAYGVAWLLHRAGLAGVAKWLVHETRWGRAAERGIRTCFRSAGGKETRS